MRTPLYVWALLQGGPPRSRCAQRRTPWPTNHGAAESASERTVPITRYFFEQAQRGDKVAVRSHVGTEEEPRPEAKKALRLSLSGVAGEAAVDAATVGGEPHAGHGPPFV